MCFVYWSLVLVSQAGISGYAIYAGVDVCAFYFKAISLRRRLLIPRSGQIGNCCRSRGMKESQINGLGVPVREIKLIRAHTRAFSRCEKWSRPRKRKWICVSRGPSDKGLESIPPQMLPAKLQNQRARRSNFINSHQLGQKRVVVCGSWKRPPPVTSLSEHQQVFPCWWRFDPAAAAQHSRSRPKQNFTCALECQRFLSRHKGWAPCSPSVAQN